MRRPRADTIFMSDLSQLLGDLYADDTPAKAPAWSSDEALDEAFSSWVPGPSDDAPSAQRLVVAGAADEPVFASLDTASPWDVELEPNVELEAAPLATAVVTARWTPSDDDILPSRGPRRRRRR